MPTPAGDALLALPRAGSGTGLHRVSWLVSESRRDLPHGPQCIKIVGSKGKGSTAAILHSILQQLLPCGLFTSPHLADVEERFLVGAEIVTPAALMTAVEWVTSAFERRPAWMEGDTLGFFEAATAAMWRLFSSSSLEVAVVEAGIGGRLDATRALPGALAGLTSVELEHASLLGPTLDHVAFDKSEICPAGGTLFASATGTPLDRRLAAYCAMRGVRLRWAHEAVRVCEAACNRDGTRLRLETDDGEIRDAWLALLGPHQVANAQCAIALALAWAEGRYEWEAIAPAIRAGLGGVACAGRFERIGSGPDLFIDVCHTPGSASACARTARECLAGAGLLLVVGASFDKDVEGIVSSLAPVARVVVATTAHHKGAPVARILDAARSANAAADVFTADSVDEAVPLARRIASERGLTVLVAGGLFLAVEARTVLMGRDPSGLQFF
jgi:dihydrofolate synthase/folylpolyglutamate synthase